MKKYLYLAALALVTVPMAAQETYENAKIATEDLNGTARFVGMGGAMDALGADISTISTNPAGIGLFRRSYIGVSAGLLSQEDAETFAGSKKTNISFDQVGFVWVNPISENSFVNFSFSYRKSRNFNQVLSVLHDLDGASQNKATANKHDQGLLCEEKVDASGKVFPDFDASYSTCSVLDDLYARNLNYNATDRRWYFYDGEQYAFDRRHKGYIGEYNFNLSGNSNDKVYWGITVGIHDVNYSHYSEYSENLVGGLGGVPQKYGLTIADDRTITGTGTDVKVGLIFRPIEESPFRFGVSVATPTWYRLTTSCYTTFNDNTNVSDGTNDEYKFKLYTPWKFGLSAGHTFGNNLALGFGYEFADYSSMDTRNLRDGYSWDDYDSSESDNEMNRHTEKTLKGVSTIKAGLEFKPDPTVAVRFGYNYVSPMYEKDGFKDTWVNSMGSYHSSTSDFTNWEATHRITCGLGFQLDKWNLAAAYQYSVQNGYFAPFDTDFAFPNVADLVKVNNKRHQVLLTLGYSF